ncbi:hypothetical protein BJV74DRAFT_572028 [Russula compacta]|nr:hypothetical protein BJV74DRAFT_572028 [Russula compacta]
MAPLLFTLLLLIFSAATPLHAFQLHHRILHPSLPQLSFHNRASILSDVAGNPRIDPAPTFQSDFAAFAEAAHVTDALYQLALDPGSDSPWLISSVKACHLVDTANEHIILHLPHPGGTPFALEYFLDSAPFDGTCPPGRPSLALPQNVTITISVPKRPPLFVVIVLMSDQIPHCNPFYRPHLRVPLPLTSTGDPIVPEPEKSFLQKYWLYIVIALGALLIAPGEEGPRES